MRLQYTLFALAAINLEHSATGDNAQVYIRRRDLEEGQGLATKVRLLKYFIYDYAL